MAGGESEGTHGGGVSGGANFFPRGGLQIRANGVPLFFI